MFPQKKKEHLVIDLVDVKTLYGKQNLASSSLFAGGFINFGYWKNLDINGVISKKTRILSSKNLYMETFEKLDISKEDAVLEVGCGLGNGCVLADKIHHPKYIIGLDISREQIQRAITKHEKYLSGREDRIKFIVSSAENIPIKSQSITKIFSVEALQHFSSQDVFLNSADSVLAKNGKFVIATFFFKTSPSKKFMNLFPNFTNGIDKIIKIKDFISRLKYYNFKNIKIYQLGENVWEGFGRWVFQSNYKDTWDKHWIWAYRNGFLDYFIIEAEKC
jgi:ubiquinone/menaquinone biosynthesis C-methylase UbiE